MIFDNSHVEIVNKLIHAFSDYVQHLNVYIESWMVDKIIIPVDVNCQVVIQAICFNQRIESSLLGVNSPIIFSSIETANTSIIKQINSIKNPKYVIVHNVNFWQKKMKWLKIFPTARSDKHAEMLILMKTADGLIVLSSEIKNSITKKAMKRKTLVFQSGVCEFENKKKLDLNKIVIVIPGQYEEKRKDYELAIELVKSLPKNRYEFIFLGSPICDFGFELITKIKTLIKQGYSIKYYVQFVSENEFNTEMQRADIVFAPIKINTTFQGIKETYTKTKFSGSIADMIRFQKPGIIPLNIAEPKEYRNALFKYKDINDIIDFFQQNKINEYRRNAMYSSSDLRPIVNEDFIKRILKNNESIN